MRKYFTFCLIVLIPLYGWGQINANEPNYISPSPKASSLAKFGEIPVNYTAGAATKNIPLFTLQEQGIQIPVSANYFYTGYRPTEGESELGYGWRLQAGGAITRVVHGLADEGFNGFIQEGPNFGFNPTVQQVFDLANRNIDGEPDMFSFNFMGYSGQFFFGNDGNIHFVNHKPFKVEYTYITSDPDFPIGDNAFSSFTITTGDGFKYIFENYEASRSNVSSSGPFIAGAINAWYLSKIIGTKGEVVEFRYQRQPTSQQRANLSMSQKKFLVPGLTSSSGVPTVQKNISLETYLTEIEGSLWKVELNYSSHSQTLFSTSSDWKLLSSIVLKDKTKSGIPSIQSYDFTYSSSNRLLKQIQEKGSDGSNLPPFQFIYNFEGVINYNPSFSGIDLWGYLNNGFGNFSLGTMIPENGADRNPSFSQASIFSLKKIIYPTKAETSFEYELNDVSFLRGNTYTREIITRKLCRFVWDYNSTSGIWTLDQATNDSIYINEDSKYNLVYDPVFVLEQTFCKNRINQDLFAQAAPYTALDFQPHPVCFGIREDTATLAVEVEFLIKTTQGSGSSNNPKIPIGGVRIKKITYDAKELNSPKTSYEYVYEKFDQPGVSSGSLVADIKTEYGITVNFLVEGTQSGLLQRAAPFSPMALNAVEYDEVLELKNGKPFKKHYFTNNLFPFSATDDFGTIIGNNAGVAYDFNSPDQFGPYDSFNFLRGLSDTTKSFDDAIQAAQDETRYVRKGILLSEIETYRANAFYPELLFNSSQGDPIIALKRYNVSSSWPRKIEDIQTLYSLTNGDTVRTRTKYFYDNPDHLQLTKTTMINSNGEEFDMITKFPLDYTGGIHSSLQFMQDSNYVTYPVEVQKWHRPTASSSSNLVDAQIMTYQIKPIIGGALTNLVLPKQTYGYNNHVASSSFVPFDPSLNTVNSTSYRPFHDYVSFNEKGNPTEVSFREYQSYAFLWGYENNRLLASVRNATFSDLSTAITSSGETLSGMTSLTDPTVIASKLALIQSQASLDAAQMTYQSFDPIYGLLQTTSPHGLRGSVDYDVFGRLHLTKDHNDHITSRTQYFYKP